MFSFIVRKIFLLISFPFAGCSLFCFFLVQSILIRIERNVSWRSLDLYQREQVHQHQRSISELDDEERQFSTTIRSSFRSKFHFVRLTEATVSSRIFLNRSQGDFRRLSFVPKTRCWTQSMLRCAQKFLSFVKFYFLQNPSPNDFCRWFFHEKLKLLCSIECQFKVGILAAAYSTFDGHFSFFNQLRMTCSTFSPTAKHDLNNPSRAPSDRSSPLSLFSLRFEKFSDLLWCSTGFDECQCERVSPHHSSEENLPHWFRFLLISSLIAFLRFPQIQVVDECRWQTDRDDHQINFDPFQHGQELSGSFPVKFQFISTICCRRFIGIFPSNRFNWAVVQNLPIRTDSSFLSLSNFPMICSAIAHVPTWTELRKTKVMFHWGHRDSFRIETIDSSADPRQNKEGTDRYGLSFVSYGDAQIGRGETPFIGGDQRTRFGTMAWHFRERSFDRKDEDMDECIGKETCCV